MTRLTSRSDGRGQPLSAVVASWAAGNPGIRRVWLSASPAADAREEDIALTLELQPVADSEETLAIWMAHGEGWRGELQARIGQAVALDWRDPDDGTMVPPLPTERPRTLIYERVRQSG